MDDRFDAEDAALEEYVSAECVVVRTERRRIWIGPPYFRYVWREVEVRDLAKRLPVQKSEKPYVMPVRPNEKKRVEGSASDITERWLRENGPHGFSEINKGTGIAISTLVYVCKMCPRIVRNTETKKWGVID